MPIGKAYAIRTGNGAVQGSYDFSALMAVGSVAPKVGSK
jgi:hypothetical protein